MKIFSRIALLIIPGLGLWSMDFSPQFPHLPVLVPAAQAIVGRPVTPVSVAGVARRTTRRAVVASSSAQQQQASQQQAAQQQPAEQQPAPASTGAPPPGTVVTALPAGCTSTVMDGVNLFNCADVLYEPRFQSNNLVYVVK